MQQEGPVTLAVRHRIKPGREAEFEEWLRGISREAMTFDGHFGYNVVRPSDTGRPEYLVFLRFDTFDNLERWEASEARQQWLGRLAPMTLHPPTREKHTGMEVWFTPPSGRSAPPRYKMAAVSLLAIYPLILLAQWALGPLLAGWPVPLRTLATSAILVGLMTYLVMPLMTRVFTRWLYGPPGG